MRILFWTGAFWPFIGGTKVLATQHLSALEKQGFEFLVVTSLDSPNLSLVDEYKGIPIRRFPFWQCRKDPEQLLKIQQQISALKREFAPDLIHLNTISRNHFFYHLTASVHPTPLLVSLHGLTVPQAHGLMRQSLRQADWVVGCSKYILTDGWRKAPEIISRSSVLYNGLEAPKLEPSPLILDPPRLLCLGRLVPEKGFDLALKALAALRPRFPQVQLVIAGDGPARLDLERQAKTLGIRKSVTFEGWVHPDRVPELVNSSSLVIMPTRCEEGFGLVALQAALMARPIVATRVGGIPEVILHQQTGLLVDKEDSEALSHAVAHLLDHSEIANEMGQTARKWALKKFGLDRYVSEYTALYRSLIVKEKETQNHQVVAT